MWVLDKPAPATGAPDAAAPADRAAPQGSGGDLDAPPGAVRLHTQYRCRSLVLTVSWQYHMYTMSGAAWRISLLPQYKHANSCMPSMSIAESSLHAGTHARAKPGLHSLPCTIPSLPACMGS